LLDFGCEQRPETCNNTYDPCGVTEQEFICQALKLLPDDALWQRNGCNFTEVFSSIAATYYQQWARACALRKEANPCTAQERLEDWAKIWDSDCGSLPTNSDELSEALCTLLSYEGQLTCSFIEDYMASIGYIVNRCETDTETQDTETVKYCGTATRLGLYPRQITQSCQSKYAGIPCSQSCCVGVDAPDVDPTDPCEVQVNLPFCSCGSGCNSGLGVFVEKRYFALKSPHTVNLFIDESSPAIAPCDLPNGMVPHGGGLGHGSNCLTIKDDACVIEALRPAHYTINYRIDCS